jgi:hypothetical protein
MRSSIGRGWFVLGMVGLMGTADAQRALPGSAPSGTSVDEAGLRDTTQLRFPNGIQGFEALPLGSPVETIAGWRLRTLAPHLYSARVVDDVLGVQGGGGRWLRVADTSASEWRAGLRTNAVQPPDERNYAWTMRLAIEELAGAGPSRPTLMSQHLGQDGYRDVFGAELAADGLYLVVRAHGGDPRRARLCTWDGATAFGQWIELELAVDFDGGFVTGRVNDDAPVRLPLALERGTLAGDFMLVHHGEGLGNAATFLLDDLGIAFGASLCEEILTVDFDTEDDFATPLVNGQDLSTPPEFGELFALSSSGPNIGPAIFDSTPGGPNDPSQDRDLLVGLGNLLILQTGDAPMQTVPGIFDRPNDDEDGGTLFFSFTRPLEVLSLELVDIDSGSEQQAMVTLTDGAGRSRIYDVPSRWTEDILADGPPGFRTLDTTTLLPQPGFASVATAMEDPGFDPQDVVLLAVSFGSSGAMDGLELRIPCVLLDFETEDDGMSALVNGQDISTPPEFGAFVAISGTGPNGGPAIFDSTPGGPNDPSQDLDLLVGLGNLLILQNNAPVSLVQTIPGIFDNPNDDADGGSIIFDFNSPAQPRSIEIVDIDPGQPNATTLVLTDVSGDQRTFTVPPGFTEDLVADGPPGFRSIDLRSLAAQPGFASSVTATEDPGFDENQVVELRVNFGSSGAVDNFCFCP